MKKSIIFLILAIPFLFMSCTANKSARDNKDGDSLLFRYAKNISVVAHNGGYYTVEIADPWNKGKVLHRYLLKRKGDQTPAGANGMTVVNIPLTKALVSTSVHCELANSLGCRNAVRGVCDAAYLKSGWITDGLKKGFIADCGNSMSPNIERIITLSPDAIFLSPMQNTGGYGKVESLGIPIIELADYMEPTALGRAEWVKFYALLFGNEKKGEQMFDSMLRSYLSLKKKAMATKTRPTAIMDKIESGVWYMPGGRSTIAQLLSDAGIRYAYAADKSSGSIQKSFETVLTQYAGADLWLMRYYKADGTRLSLAELSAENKGYSLFRAYKESRVFGCNTATSAFFEETPFRPDLLLRDFIVIAHPEAMKGEGAKYFERLK